MKLTSRQIALNGIVAGLYAGITLLTSSLSFGPVQFRAAEALCLLVCLDPSLTVGVTLGCLIANLFSTVSALDIVIGTAATLLGCLLTVRIRKVFLMPLPTILCNGLLVGALLSLHVPEAQFWKLFLISGGQVAAGETLVLYLLGVPLYLFLKKSGLIGQLLRERR